jgi:chromosomal replication initiation ATPase DnaA
MKERFIRTKSVNKYFEAIERVNRRKRKGFERMILIIGEPGLGKTESSLYYAAMNGAVMVRMLELMSGPWLLRKIVSELGGEPLHRSDKNMDLICELLHEKPRVLIFDEIDRFARNPKIVESIRDIHDLNFGSPIIFVGEEHADKKLAQNRRLFRRFVEIIKFERLDLDGTRDFLSEISDVKYLDDAVEKIFVNTNGKISNIMMAVDHAEAVARGLQTKTIQGKDLKWKVD